jgi:hypothetical protein
LFQRANDQGWSQLATLARDEWSIVPDTVRVQIEQETFAQGLHAISPELSGRLVARVTGLAYENATFNRLAEAAWAVSLPAGFKPLGGTVDMTVPEYLGQDAAGPLYRVGVRGRIIRELDGGTLAARLRGATLAEARAALSTRDGLSAPAEIEIWPDWAPRAFRLQVFQVRTE